MSTVLRSFVVGALAVVNSGMALGQSVVVVPPSLAAVAGTANNNIPLGSNTGGTYMVLYAADQLTAIAPGSVITGLQMRLRNAATANWPPSASSFTSYEVRMAASPLTPATMSNTLANNMTNPVLVRSGVLNLAANAYPGGGASGSTPEAWGPMIAFTTGYVYQGGVLAIEFRNGGIGGPPGVSADTIPSEARAAGRGNITSPNETSGGNTSGLIVRLSFSTPTTVFQTGITRAVILGETAMVRGSATTNNLLNASPRTAQLDIDENELRGLGPGSRIIGMGYRAGTSAGWPATAQDFTKYDIQLSKALNPPNTMSDTVASNVGPDAVMVRSGALAVAANSILPWPAPPGYAPWSFEIPFANQYTFVGGPLLSVIRSDGVSGLLGGEVDAIALASAPYGTRVKGRVNVASSTATTTPSALPFPVERFSVDAGTFTPKSSATAYSTPLSNLIQPTPTTIQVIVSASELTYVPIGSQITSFSYQPHAGEAAYPAAEGASVDYQVFMSTARRHPGSASMVFAENDGTDVLQVRSGAMRLAAGSFPAGTGPAVFTAPVEFQRPFVYRGGDLCITIRNAGNSNAALPLVEGVLDTSRSRLRFDATSTGTTSNADYPFGVVLRFGYNPSVVVPTASTGSPGADGYSLFLLASGNVMQGVYAEDQFRNLRIGSVITGLSLRQHNFQAGYATWPPSDIAVTRFDITVSTSPRTPSAISDTFASNIGADAVLVRSGPITIPAKAFPYQFSSTVPNDNVWFIQFTKPFVYKGGPLSVTFRTDSGAGGSTMYFDSSAVGAASAGRWSFGAGADATVHSAGGLQNALTLRLVFVPQGFCSSDLNNDGVVDDGDFQQFVLVYNILDCNDSSMPLGCTADFNFDGVVEDADFVIFLAAYNELLCP